ncbi:MAG: hypothetical protein M1385_00995 [Candidatus Marsarchaeota archaeon]|nr:hypothetical protein [Candidatus Marsarchaeota archaeon]
MEKDIITQKPTMQKQKDSLDFPKTKKSKIDEIFKDFNTKIEHNGKTSMAMRIEKGITDVYNRTKEYLNSLFKTAAIDSFKKIKQGIAIGTVLIGNLFNTAAVPNTFADANTYLKPQTYQVGVNGIKRINEYGQFGLIYTENTRSLHYQVIAKPIKNGTICHCL